MNNIFNKLTRTVALTVTTGLLSTGVASAQTVVKAVTPAARTQISQSSLRGVTTPATLDRIVVQNRPVTVPGFDGGDPIKCDPASVAAAAAVVAAAATLAMLATEVVHHMHDSYLPSGVDLGSRGNLVNVGMYDR